MWPYSTKGYTLKIIIISLIVWKNYVQIQVIHFYIISTLFQFWQFGNLKEGRKEGNVLFNDTLNTFYLQLYGIRHMVKEHSASERGNPLPPHGLLFPISSKGSFIWNEK